MALTKRQIAAAVRDLGLVAVWSAEWREWKINYRQTDPRYVRGEMGSSYHTADNADALATAEAMAVLA